MIDVARGDCINLRYATVTIVPPLRRSVILHFQGGQGRTRATFFVLG
jgi:hypothetical protein